MILSAEQPAQSRIGQSEFLPAQEHGHLSGQHDLLVPLAAKDGLHIHLETLGNLVENDLGSCLRGLFILASPQDVLENGLGNIPFEEFPERPELVEKPMKASEFLVSLGQSEHLRLGEADLFPLALVLDIFEADIQVRFGKLHHEAAFQSRSELKRNGPAAA